MKNNHGGMILLVKLQALACNFTKSIPPPWFFSRFLNCTNGTKSCKASNIVTINNINTKLGEYLGPCQTSMITQPAFTCSKSTMDTPQKKYKKGFIYCSGVSIVNFEQVNAG